MYRCYTNTTLHYPNDFHIRPFAYVAQNTNIPDLESLLWQLDATSDYCNLNLYTSGFRSMSRSGQAHNA